MQFEQETLWSYDDQNQGTILGNGWRDLPLGGFSLGCLRKSPWHPAVLLGEVSSGAVSVPSVQLIQWPVKALGAHQARKKILLLEWLAEEVVWRETTNKYCLHVVFGFFLPARDSIFCACTVVLHRLLQAALGPCLRAKPSLLLFCLLNLIVALWLQPQRWHCCEQFGSFSLLFQMVPLACSREGVVPGRDKAASVLRMCWGVCF